MITILTNTPLTLKNLPERGLKAIKVQCLKFLYLLTRKPKFLPDAEIEDTIASLKRGFAQLDIHYQLNPWASSVSEQVGVIGSPDALAWALEQKRSGAIKKLVANIKNTDPAIDTLLVPTEAVKEQWSETDQYFNQKAIVWTAGVADVGADRIETDPAKGGQVCIVYSRNADEKLFSHIMETLWEHKITIVVSNYGQFRSHEYVHLLKQAKFVIYLDDFQSQPLGLYAAWMAGVPSLIHSASAVFPYECGLSFTGADDFESKLLEFIERYKNFNPRPYAQAHHTDAISAGAYRTIIEGI